MKGITPNSPVYNEIKRCFLKQQGKEKQERGLRLGHKMAAFSILILLYSVLSLSLVVDRF
jgi:hypothetical protein